MKKILILVLSFLSLTNVFANKKDDQIVYAMLMNQIQFSLQTIQYYQNRIVLDQEYNNIICKIDKTKLKDEDNKAIYAFDLNRNETSRKRKNICYTRSGKRKKRSPL